MYHDARVKRQVYLWCAEFLTRENEDLIDTEYLKEADVGYYMF
jgi:hypothetical protein